MSNPEDSLSLFVNGFAARDLAEPLPSFDDTAPLSVISVAMNDQQLDVVGVRHSGAIAGWLTRDDVVAGREPSQCRTFEPASVIPDTASLNGVVQGLNSTPHLFVRNFGDVSGVIGRRDLDKPPMRMWLFGLVTISELRVTQMIDECCPNDTWHQYLSEGRLQKARGLQLERCRRGHHPTLLDCLQFADKGQIVARDESLRRRTRFASRREAEKFVMALQDLRNNLAHSQDIAGDWDVIHELATNLHRIVLGPPTAEEPSDNQP